MPVGCLFIGEGDVQQSLFAEGLTHNLQANRQIVGEAGGYRYGRHSSYVQGQRAYVAQIHLHWVFQLLTQLKGHYG